jgi:transposase
MKTMPATQVAGIVIMGFVRGDSRDQGALFPVALDELVPADHVCRVIDSFVGSLELVPLGFSKAQPTATGRPAYDPADLLKLYLYGYLQQVRSSRRLERECQRNVELMWLLNRLAPDHKTIAEFRRREGAPMRAVAAAFVRFCRSQGLIRGEWLAIDGSKFEAVASRKAVLSRERLLREQAALDRRVAEYLERLDAADAEEGESTIDAAAVREALEVLRRQQSQTAQGLSRLEALGATQWVASEPDAKQMKGHGPAYNVQTVARGSLHSNARCAELLQVPIRREHRVHPHVLSRGELDHAGIVRVIHEVVDRIEAREARAGIPVHRTPVRGRALRRRIRHGIPAGVLARTAALERVIQPHPVPDLVRRRVTEVIGRSIAARQRRAQHHHAVPARR